MVEARHLRALGQHVGQRHAADALARGHVRGEAHAAPREAHRTPAVALLLPRGEVQPRRLPALGRVEVGQKVNLEIDAQTQAIVGTVQEALRDPEMRTQFLGID